MKAQAVSASFLVTAALAVSSALTLPALAISAAAKEPATARVCGASGCRAGDAYALSPVDGRPFALRAAPKPAPYYVVVLRASGEYGFCWRLIWVPGSRALRVENLGRYVPGAPVAGRYWRSVNSRLARGLARGVQGVRPYPARGAWQGPPPACS